MTCPVCLGYGSVEARYPWGVREERCEDCRGTGETDGPEYDSAPDFDASDVPLEMLP